MRALFGGRKHELTVSTYQMCILMLFNTRVRWSFAYVCAECARVCVCVCVHLCVCARARVCARACVTIACGHQGHP